MVIHRVTALVASLVLGGCVINANRGRPTTLPYHPAFASLAEDAIDADADLSAPPARTVAADLRVEALVGYYPDVYGLEYSGDGAFRRLRVAWQMLRDGSVTPPEERLTAGMRTLLPGGGGRPVLLSGAVVELAMYRIGADIIGGATVELRVIVDGDETYTGRYRVRARTRRGDVPPMESLWPAIEASLLGQMSRDEALAEAIDRGGQS